MQHDERTQSDGLIPASQDAAMLDWLREQHPDRYAALQQLSYAMTNTGTSESIRAFDERIEQLRALWRAARKPDPHGRLSRPRGGAAGQIWH